MKAATSAPRATLTRERTFQSTPPVKAATSLIENLPIIIIISIHAAREGGDQHLSALRAALYISIHAAREGGDRKPAPACRCCCRFQSTPPVKAATLYFDCFPHSWLFQSTPPVKAATIDIIGYSYKFSISIHAAREGGDQRHTEFIILLRISIHAAREGGDD